MGNHITDIVASGFRLSGKATEVGQSSLLVFESSTSRLEPRGKDVQLRAELKDNKIIRITIFLNILGILPQFPKFIAGCF